MSRARLEKERCCETMCAELLSVDVDLAVNVTGDVFTPFIGVSVDGPYVQGVDILHGSPRDVGMVDVGGGDVVVDCSGGASLVSSFVVSDLVTIPLFSVRGTVSDVEVAYQRVAMPGHLVSSICHCRQ
jgi:hypothetical protein